MTASIYWFDAAISKYLAGRLARFRTRLEKEAERPIGDLELNAALFLSDLGRLLGLDKLQHNHVLGEHGVQYVLEVSEARVSLRLDLLPAQRMPAPEAVEVAAIMLPEDDHQ